MNTAHIVTIRKAGAIVGHQLRTGRGPGQSTYFSAGSYGGADEALHAARKHARQAGLKLGGKRGGSLKGRPTHATRTPAAGIRFEWMDRTTGPVLRVVATWTDKRGRPRHTSYSVERNGLEGALQKAVAARTSAGAPAVDYHAMLAALQDAYRKGPQ